MFIPNILSSRKLQKGGYWAFILGPTRFHLSLPSHPISYFNPLSPSASRIRGRGLGFLRARNSHGEPNRPHSEEHPRHEPPEPRGEDSSVEDLSDHILEGAVLRPHRRNLSGQGHGAGPPRRDLRRQPQAHPLHVPRHEDAPDPAREGHRRRVHQE